MKRPSIRYGLLVVLWPAVSFGQSPNPPQATFNQFYDALEDSTIKTLTRNAETIEDAAEQARRGGRSARVSLQAPSLGTAGGSTAAEVAQAAISTAVAGADAGVSVSPLGLVGHADAAVQPTITVAALKDSITRFQLGASWQSAPVALGSLPSCKPDTAQEKELRNQMEHVRAVYSRACAAVSNIVLIAKPAGRDEDVNGYLETMQAACGGGPLEPPLTVGTGRTWLTYSFSKLQTMYVQAAAAEASLVGPRDLLNGLEPVFADDVLNAYTPPAPDDCHDADALSEAVTRAVWNASRLRIGVSIRADLYPRLFGFKPEEPIYDGRLKESEVRADVSFSRRGFEVTAGIGYGTSRMEFAEERIEYLSPALSIAGTVARLSGTRLYDSNNRLNLVDGAPPPRLVLGIDVQLQYALSQPAYQVAKIQKASITGYADVRFTDKVTVRLGLPVSAALATRKSKDAMPVILKRDRQWTIPVFVATVIKF